MIYPLNVEGAGSATRLMNKTVGNCPGGALRYKQMAVFCNPNPPTPLNQNTQKHLPEATSSVSSNSPHLHVFYSPPSPPHSPPPAKCSVNLLSVLIA